MPTKVKYSRFLFTFNGNVKPNGYPGGEEGLKEKYALCGEMLKKQYLKPLIYILRKEDSFEKNILNVKVDYAVEKNSRNFWHCHAYVEIQHTTSLRAQYPVIKARMLKILGIKNGHFDAKLIRAKGSAQTVADVRNYIHKNDNKNDDNGGGEGFATNHK